MYDRVHYHAIDLRLVLIGRALNVTVVVVVVVVAVVMVRSYPNTLDNVFYLATRVVISEALQAVTYR